MPKALLITDCRVHLKLVMVRRAHEANVTKRGTALLFAGLTWLFTKASFDI